MREWKDDPYPKEAILEVVEKQIRYREPPETKRTYDRLLREGRSEEEAKHLIGQVVCAEIFEALQRKHKFTIGNYILALQKLP
jgi:hypothetical protein